MRFPGVDGKSRGKPGAKCSVPFCGEPLNPCPLYLKVTKNRCAAGVNMGAWYGASSATQTRC